MRLISSDPTSAESYSLPVEQFNQGASSGVLQMFGAGEIFGRPDPMGTWYVQSAQYGQRTCFMTISQLRRPDKLIRWRLFCGMTARP